MDFRLTDDQRELQDAARKFARAELPELARDMEEKDYSVPRDMMRKYGEMGFLGVNLPTEYGGLGLGHVEALLVLEEFAQISNAVAFPVFEALVGPVRTIERFGSDAMKARILPEVIQGEKVVAVSMSEPDAGTALTDLKTRAVADGDDYVVNGYKRWTSGGGHSDYYVTYCRYNDEPGAKGIGAILLEKDAPGMQFGKREQLMGFRGIDTADYAIEDVRVPKENVIVGAGGFGRLMSAFGLERCGNATQSLGLAAAALEQATAYVQEREAFGKPIVEFQAVQLKLAEMAMKVDASRLLIHRAAANAAHQEDGLPTVYEGSVAKCYANEIVREVTAMGLQVMGGYGYVAEYHVERLWRDAKLLEIGGGTLESHQKNITRDLRKDGDAVNR